MTNNIIVMIGLIVLATLFLMGMLARMYRKAGPNEAIIVYGFGGPKVIIGHGALVLSDGATCALALSGTDEL